MHRECIEADHIDRPKWGGGKIEFVIVDDGSTDLTAKIVSGYAKGNSIIKFIQLPHNSGTNAARNAAIKAATGDWIIILDSDDYFADDAVEQICSTVLAHPEYRHFMFAPDDVCYADSFFNNCPSKVLTYEDFLKGSVKTGFIHCIATDTMRKHPFDEQVRIHEGVFFLSFYKEAGKMLFTKNHVVTIRERGREDSVTLNCVRSKRSFIERAIKADEILIDRFGRDFCKYDCRKTLSNIYTRLFDNYLLLGRYKEITDLKKLYANNYVTYKTKSDKQNILNLLAWMHLGKPYRHMLQVFLFVKYRILKHRIR